ncbi:MAG: hypothetical protein HZB16_12510 [Armatimonadetes bacterium]|nr:hypothetical protein [Armatimonadota bacterium]
MRRRLALLMLACAVLALGGCRRPRLASRDRVDAPPSAPGDGGGLATAEPMTLNGGTMAGPTTLAASPLPNAPTATGPAVAGNLPPAVAAALPAKMVRAPSNVTTSGGVVESPTDGAAFADGKLPLKLGSADSKFYLAQIDAHLTRLVKAGEAVSISDLKPGPHVLRVIPCDEKGVVSMTAAQSVRTFTIGPTPMPVPGFSASAPIINIGRPFGDAKLDDIGAVLMDLRIDGVKLSEAGTMLKYKLDNAPDSDAAVVTSYPPTAPVQLFGLDPGKHKLIAWLELDGKRIENGGVTRVEREFTVSK